MSKEDDLPAVKTKIEAILFSSKVPLRIVDLSHILELDRRVVRRAMRSLRGDYRRRNTALEIFKSNGKYMLRLRSGYEDIARQVTSVDMDRRTITVMAYIALYQPIAQSDVVRRFGTRAYGHIRTLEERRLVRWRRHGNTKILVTGPKFAEHFGLKSSSPRHVKAWIAEKLGVDVPGGGKDPAPPPEG